MPSLVSNLGSSCPEMLNIIHNPPEGSVHLITLVYHPFPDLCLYIILMKICPICLFFVLILKILQTLTDESTPSADLVAAVKQLYNTLKVCVQSARALYCLKFTCLHFWQFFVCLFNVFAESCDFLWQDASILIPLLPSFPKEEVYVSNFITPSNVPNLWWCFNFDHLVCLMQTFVFLVVQIYLGMTWQYGMPN